ncbi:MAG: 4-hydroxythreonine-4-phosphate dehydrogenase PdxA [Sphingomonadales bacterium]|nr:4-hydroxythreonine-4-phosphate dehydrogenase PdxA [Sphingomonadales bacterium]
MTGPLAVSLGDPAGVGPELLAAAWAARGEHGSAAFPAPFFAVGGADLLQQAAARRGLAITVQRIADPAEAAATFATALPVLGDEDCAYRPGEPDRAGAEFALASLTRAAALATSGAAAGVVTGPVAKSRLAEIGFVHPGQTEFVAAACGIAPEDAVMMLAGPSLRTVPLTVHVALADVPGLVTQELIERRARIIAAALAQDFGLPAARIAVAALNPHAGEDGRFGSEDQRVVAPAIAALRAAGIAATGPHPADALFAPHARESFDVALCMYHDQALIPIKALDFDAGVNVTLGLPIIRTSPDHGTAFAIAGKGLAHPGATIAALRMAGECAARRLAERAARRAAS